MAVRNWNWEDLAALVARVKEQDSDAFVELYNGMYLKVYFLALSIVKDEHLAQDVVQETFINVYKSISTLENNKTFMAWLNKITYHCSLKVLEENDEVPIAGTIMEHENTGSSANEPLEVFLMKEKREAIIEKILELPQEYSSTILLKYYRELKLEEIAGILNCSVGTIKSRLSRGKSALKKKRIFVDEQLFYMKVVWT